MPQPLPHEYEASLERAGPAPAVISAGARPVVAVGPPPEFGGAADHWSPEHLLLSALNACLLATFDAAARTHGLRVESYSSRAGARLAKTEAGVGFTGFWLSVRIETASGEEDAVRATLLRAKERCFVANALRAPVRLEVTVAAVAAPRPTEDCGATSSRAPS